MNKTKRLFSAAKNTKRTKTIVGSVVFMAKTNKERE